MIIMKELTLYVPLCVCLLNSESSTLELAWFISVRNLSHSIIGYIISLIYKLG